MGKGGKKGGAKVEVTLYYMSIHFGICVAADALRRIIIKEKEAWAGRVSLLTNIRINKEDLFGGKKKEGGVSGIVTYLPGGGSQLMPDALAQKLGRANGADCPGFRGLTSLFFHGGGGSATFSSSFAEGFFSALLGISVGRGFYWSANVPYLPSVWVTVERAPVGLTASYARILRIGQDEHPFETPTTGIAADGTFLFGPDDETAAYWQPNGFITWWDVPSMSIIGTSPGGPFAGSVDDVDLTVDGVAFYMGLDGSDRNLYATAPGGAVTFETTDSPSFQFETTRAFGSGSSVDIFSSYQTHSGYVHNITYITDPESARDHWEDDHGHIWQLLQPTGSSDSLTLRDLTDTGTEFALTGPVTRSGPSHARGCFTSYGKHFIHTDGHFLIVNPDDGTIESSGTAPWNDPPKLPRHNPSAVTFWDDWTEYSLEDGSVRRTVVPDDWRLTSDSGMTYDPVNNAIWSRFSGGSHEAVIRLLDRGDFDANPAHIIFECLTNTMWGMGSPETLMDVASFELAGVTLFDEQLGLSMIWTRQAAIQDFVQEVLDHIQAVLYVDPTTGLLTLKLIRGDYDTATLPVLTPSNADLSNFGRKLWGEIINEIVVTWTNPENEQDETVAVHDLASIATQGGVVSDSRNYYGVRTAAMADRLARRDLRASGSPLATCEAVVDRTEWQLRPASCVKLNWPEYGLSGTIMRVTEVDYGKPGDPAITLQLVEDVFGLDVGSYIEPPGSIFDDGSTLPRALDHSQILTLPYYAASQAGVVETATYPDVAAGVLGTTDDTDAWNFETWGDILLSDGSTSWESLSTNSIVGYAEATADLDAEASSTAVMLTNAMGQSFPQPGGFALIGAGDDDEMELALVTDVTSIGYTLSRGILDTVPRPWPTGTPMWFFTTEDAISEPTVRAGSEDVTYRLRPRTSQGLLSLGRAPDVDFTLSDRPWLPSRPANVTIDGVLFNTHDTAVDMIGDTLVPVSWANRNRTTEDGIVLGWTDGDVTPETGQTTTIYVYAEDGTTLLDTISGLSGTSHDVPVASFGSAPIGLIRVGATRTDADGTFDSLQIHGIWVQVSPISAGALAAGGLGALSLTGQSNTSAAGALSAAGVASISLTGSSSGGGGADFGALVQKSTGDQTFGPTAGALTFDTEVYDAGGWHVTGFDNTRLTVPASISLVRITSGLRTTASFLIEQNKNGATFRGMGKADVFESGDNFATAVSAPLAVSSSDYFQTLLSKESAGSITPTNDEETWFAIEKLDPSTKYALVYHSASQSVPAAVTILAFNSEVADTNGFHDTVTNNSRLTVPSGVTLVRLCANGNGGNFTGQFNLFVRKNGANARGLPNRDTDTGSEDNINIISAPVVVTTGDYFELGAFSDVSTTVPAANDVWFSIEEVPSTYKRALVNKTGNQTFSAGVEATVSWDAEVYDTDSIHDNSTNNSRLTVPAGCTKARPIVGIRTSSVTASNRARITKNGSDYNGMPAFGCDTTGTDNINISGAWVDVAPGDYFEVRFVSVTGCTVGTDNETWFCLECQ